MTHWRPLLHPCLLTILVVVGGCARPTDVPQAPTPQEVPPRPIGVLLFGDSGYHLDWPDQDDYLELFDAGQYQQNEWQSWLDDKRPPDEYRPRVSAVSPVTGKVVPASGLAPVATAMQRFCAREAACYFGLLLGDNIYPSGLTLGADGRDDQQRLQDMLVDPFGALVTEPASYLTYVALGNHDWETSRAAGFAQIEFLEQAPGFYMDGPFYSVQPAGFEGEVELFVLDTSMLLATATVYEDSLDDEGNEIVTNIVSPPDYFVEPLTEAERNMAQWLESALQTSTAKWKIVAAHHPIWSTSGSKFEQGRALRRMLLPAMCRYADLYVVGHDHTLEIHSDDCSAALGAATPTPLVEVVSGAAAKQRPINSRFAARQQETYPELTTVWARGLMWGFAYLRLDGDQAMIELYSVPDTGEPEFSKAFGYTVERRSQGAGTDP